MNDVQSIKGIKSMLLQKCSGGIFQTIEDKLVEEAPLQIMITCGNADKRQTVPLSVTMRTPGDDHNLVTGFLFCEEIIRTTGDIKSIQSLAGENTILVELKEEVPFDATKRNRNFAATASCGFCGKTTAELMGARATLPVDERVKISPAVLYTLPALLNNAQQLFTATGGVHAVSLFTAGGTLMALAEDVGRHNAMDKLVGAMLKQRRLPLSKHIVLFSGRLSYELIQKSVMAGVAVICAIGAPSSLAIQLAKDNGITVVGFLKKNSFNIYCGAEKIEQE